MKNTDTINVGDHAVITLAGESISCTVTAVNDKSARFDWQISPGKLGLRWILIPRSEFAARVTLFPAGSKFLVVERNKSDESPSFGVALRENLVQTEIVNMGIDWSDEQFTV